MKNVLVIASLLFCSAANAATSASIGAYFGTDVIENRDTGNVGFSLSAPLILGFGWWSWSGLGISLEQDKWASHVQGLDFSIGNLTTTLQYKVSKNPDLLMKRSISCEHELGMRVKVKLW